RQPTDLSPAPGSSRRNDTRRSSERRRPAAIGADGGGRVSSQSAYGPEGIPGACGRRAGGSATGVGHVHQNRRTQSAAGGRAPEISIRRMAEDFRKYPAPWPESGRAPEAQQSPGETQERGGPLGHDSY